MVGDKNNRTFFDFEITACEKICFAFFIGLPFRHVNGRSTMIFPNFPHLLKVNLKSSLMYASVILTSISMSIT